MSLAATQAAIVATLAPLLAPLKVQAHGGQFTERELPLLLAQAPAVLISSLGISGFSPKEPKLWHGDVRWVAYCLGADQQESRAEQAADAAEAVMNQLILQTWGLSDTAIRPAVLDSITAENLYSGHVNVLRVALWAVTWTQTLIFTVP